MRADNFVLRRLYSSVVACVFLASVLSCTPEEVVSPQPADPPPLPSLSCTPFIKNGYTDKQSYYPGETMTVFFDAKESSAVCRLSIFSVTGDSVFSVPALVPAAPSIPEDASENGYGFPSAAAFTVPELKSGIYLLDKKVPFVIKTHLAADLLIVYPSNTANAYAESGGHSLYSPHPRPAALSFHRPIPLQDLSQVCLKWLPTLEGFSMAYIADIDMDMPENLSQAKVLVIPGHSEYWTLKARRNFDAFVDAGGNALILSGNTMWWQVRYSDDNTKLICYKDSVGDPVADPLLRTINWNEPSLNYSILSSIGADFANGGYGLNVDAGWNGYRITKPSSPLFEGLALEQNQVIALPTAEYDGAPIVGYDEDGYPFIDEASLNFHKVELLGFDKGYRARETTGTFIVLQKTARSGVIVNTASCDWCSENGMGGPSGEIIKGITYNAIDKLANKAGVFSD